MQKCLHWIQTPVHVGIPRRCTTVEQICWNGTFSVLSDWLRTGDLIGCWLCRAILMRSSKARWMSLWNAAFSACIMQLWVELSFWDIMIVVIIQICNWRVVVHMEPEMSPSTTISLTSLGKSPITQLTINILFQTSNGLVGSAQLCFTHDFLNCRIWWVSGMPMEPTKLWFLGVIAYLDISLTLIFITLSGTPSIGTQSGCCTPGDRRHYLVKRTKLICKQLWNPRLFFLGHRFGPHNISCTFITNLINCWQEIDLFGYFDGLRFRTLTFPRCSNYWIWNVFAISTLLKWITSTGNSFHVQLPLR